jgi:hypothetical protein
MRALLAIVLLVLAPHGLRAQTASDSISADSIIDRYYEAIGGLAALLADSTLAFRGHYEEGSFRAGTTILWKRPNLRRVSVIGPNGFPYLEIFDGTDEWEITEAFDRPVQHDTGAAERAGRRGAEFDESFVDYRAKGHRVRFDGSSMLDGRRVHALSVTLADGWTKEYYFDAASGLLVALRKAMPLHAAGPDVVSLSFYRDYRRVGSVLRPFAQEERNVSTGALMNTLQWDAITANRAIRPEAFRPPVSRRDAVDGPPPRAGSTSPH